MKSKGYQNSDLGNILNINSINLFMAPADFAFLFSEKPQSLFAFQEARVVFPGKNSPQNVKIRVRGAHAWHWDARKPSFRLRTSRRKTFRGSRNLDLINPEDPTMLANLLGDFLAGQIGLAASRTRLCRVWINRQYLGLYHLCDRLDENLLPNLGMPAFPLLEGNARSLEMWKNPDKWDIRVGSADRKIQAQSALKEYLADISPPLTQAKMLNARSHTDFPGLASWSAFCAITGSVTSDDFHNQNLIFDEFRKVFRPLVSDSMGFGTFTFQRLPLSAQEVEIPLYEYLTPITDAAFRSPDFQFRRNKVIWELIETTFSSEQMVGLAGELFKRVSPLLRQEKHKGGLVIIPKLEFPIRLPVSINSIIECHNRIREWIIKRNQFLHKSLSCADVVVYPVQSGLAAAKQNLSVLEICGNAPVEWNLGTSTELIRLDINLDKQIMEEDPVPSSTLRIFPGMGPVPNSNVPWLKGGARLLKHSIQPASQTYLIGIASSSPLLLRSLFSTARNSVTKEPCKVRFSSHSLSLDRVYSLKSSLHPWQIRMN